MQTTCELVELTLAKLDATPIVNGVSQRREILMTLSEKLLVESMDRQAHYQLKWMNEIQRHSDTHRHNKNLRTMAFVMGLMIVALLLVVQHLLGGL